MIDEDLIVDESCDEQESYSDDSIFNITSFGIDMSFREIITMYDEGELEKPELQRKYVWSKKEASRFIDSILLGLPVPSIFLAKTEDDKRLIVDGYQRIMTVYDYVKNGVFGGDGRVFKLSNTETINPLWRGKTFSELPDEYKRKIRNSPIHAIVFEQKEPANDTGMYQIFERINTGGRALKPQEIRNCVYHGNFNSLLLELNKEPIWRKILGCEEDSRMADIELILRFFAFNDLPNRNEFSQSQINLTKYLNVYMGDKANLTAEQVDTYKKQFIEIMELLYRQIGDVLFRTFTYSSRSKKVNPVIFDAVCTATYNAIYRKQLTIPDNMKERYKKLISDSFFMEIIRQRTTNIDNIKNRVSIAEEYLYG